MDFGAKDGRRVFGSSRPPGPVSANDAQPDLYESAVLVGMLKAPTRYDPLRHPEAAQGAGAARAERMVAEGCISARRCRRRCRRGAPRPLRPVALDTAYYTSWVRRDSGSHAAGRCAGGTARRDRPRPGAAAPAREVIATMLRAAGSSTMRAGGIGRDGQRRAGAGAGGRGGFPRSQFDRATMGRTAAGQRVQAFVYLRALEAGANRASGAGFAAGPAAGRGIFPAAATRDELRSATAPEPQRGDGAAGRRTGPPEHCRPRAPAGDRRSPPEPCRRRSARTR